MWEYVALIAIEIETGMPTSVEQIDLWRAAAKEGQQLEFKEAKNQFDFKKLCEYCVAIANEGGGQLLLGIADKHPRAVVGTRAFPDPNNTMQDLFRQLGFRVDVEAVTHAAGRVLVFHLSARPKGTAYHHDGKYLMRSGEELVPMSENQLRRIFAEGQPNWLEEVSQNGLTADEVVKLLDTQSYFEMRSLLYPSARKGVIDRLKQDRLIAEDGKGTLSIS